MLKIVRTVLILLLILAIVISIVISNNQSITVQVGGEPITANAGVILIATFIAGGIFSGIIAMYFGVKGYLRERKLKNRERDRVAFQEGMLAARGYLVTKEWLKAREQWEKIIRKDPTNIISRVELSKSLEGAGEIREALKVIEVARTAAPQNIEVLFRAADLNLVLKNRTAALDNLALILYHHPNKVAARLARDLSEGLDRIEDALEYQSKLEALGEREPDGEEVRERLTYKKVLRDTKNGEGEESLESALKNLLKIYPNCVPALEKFAELQSQAGKTEVAAQYLMKAAKVSGEPKYWHKISKLWMEAKSPDRALSSAKAATRETRGLARLTSELELSRLYINLDMIDDANTTLEQFYQIAKQEGVDVDSSLAKDHIILKSICLSRHGDNKDSQALLVKVSSGDYTVEASKSSIPVPEGEAPAPRLSTP